MNDTTTTSHWNSPAFDTRSLASVLLALCFGAASFLLFIQENEFPYYYHPDAPGKARQIIDGTRNFHHPLLMLTVTDSVLKIAGIEKTPQKIVQTGRYCSAAFSSIAVISMVLLATLYFSLGTAAWVGFLTSVHWDIFEKAHYMKEDPALIMGLALTLLAGAWFWKRPGIFSALLLGAAAALATSGKYIGIVAVIPAVILTLNSTGDRFRRRRLTLFAAMVSAFLAILAAVNQPILEKDNEFRKGIGGEMTKISEGKWSKDKEIPHAGFVQRALRVTRPHLAIPVIYGLVWFFRNPRKRPLPLWFVVALPFAFVLILSFSQTDSGRYFLPGTLSICFIAGFGLSKLVADLLRPETRLSPGLKIALAGFCILAAVAGSLERLHRYWGGFRSDPRADLAAWIRENVPGNGIIAQGYGVHLPDPEVALYSEARFRIPQKILSTRDIPDLGTLGELKNQGVTHIAVVEPNYQRYLKPADPHQHLAELFDQRRQFFNQLFKEGKVIWAVDEDRVGTHNPPIRLFEISAPR